MTFGTIESRRVEEKWLLPGIYMPWGCAIKWLYRYFCDRIKTVRAQYNQLVIVAIIESHISNRVVDWLLFDALNMFASSKVGSLSVYIYEE